MSGGGGGGQSQTTQVSIPEEFKPFLFEERKAPSGFIGDQGQPGGIIPQAIALQQEGQLAPRSVQGETTQQAQQQLLDVAGGASGVIDPVVQNFLALQSRDPLSDPLTQQVADAATRPIFRQLEEVALPGVQDAAIGAGQFGGSRQGVAEAVLRDRAATSAGDITARIFSDALERDLLRKERGLGQAGQLLGLQTLPAQLTGQVGAQQDILAGEETNAPGRNLLQLAQLLQGFIPGASQTTTVDGGGPSRAQSVGGGALTGAGLGTQIGGPGFGTAVGAGLGALGGLLL